LRATRDLLFRGLLDRARRAVALRQLLHSGHRRRRLAGVRQAAGVLLADKGLEHVLAELHDSLYDERQPERLGERDHDELERDHHAPPHGRGLSDESRVAARHRE